MSFVIISSIIFQDERQFNSGLFKEFLSLHIFKIFGYFKIFMTKPIKLSYCSRLMLKNIAKSAWVFTIFENKDLGKFRNNLQKTMYGRMHVLQRTHKASIDKYQIDSTDARYQISYVYRSFQPSDVCCKRYGSNDIFMKS